MSLTQFRLPGKALLVGLLLASRAIAQQVPPAPEVLQGLDPVALIEGREVFGKTTLSSVHDGFTYIFATPESKAAFDKGPARYAVQYRGMCSRMGGPTSGNPDLFAVHEGRIYLFGSEDCVKAFTADPAKFIARPAEVPAISPESAAAAMALLDRAAEGFGGAARVDRLSALKTVVITARPPAQPQPGSAPSAQPPAAMPRPPVIATTVIAFPGGIWQQTRIGEMSFAAVVAPEHAFRTMQDGTRPVSAAQAAAIADDVQRMPLFLVRDRKQPGTRAWMAGKSTVAGAPVDLVSVAAGERRGTLAVDASGRVLAMTFHGRGPDGGFGEVAYTFANLRDAGGGLVMPHSYARTFNGAAWGNPVVYETIEANPAFDPAIFVRPSK